MFSTTTPPDSPLQSRFEPSGNAPNNVTPANNRTQSSNSTSNTPEKASRRHSMPHLRLPDVANILVKMRRHSRRSSPISTPPLTPPRSAKAHHIESSSGPEPQTHPSLRGDNAGVSVRKVPLIQEARYVCADAVDVVKLLRAVRAELYEKAEAIGANVLVDEQWTCTICGPRHRRDGTFKVFVRYSASAARASVPDPQRPVALENAKGVPGLMTVISRDE